MWYSRNDLKSLWRTNHQLSTLLLMGAVAGFFVMVGFLARSETNAALERTERQLKDCTYAGTRYDDGRRVYQYNCDGIIEETLYRLRDNNAK